MHHQQCSKHSLWNTPPQTDGQSLGSKVSALQCTFGDRGLNSCQFPMDSTTFIISEDGKKNSSSLSIKTIQSTTKCTLAPWLQGKLFSKPQRSITIKLCWNPAITDGKRSQKTSASQQHYLYSAAPTLMSTGLPLNYEPSLFYTGFEDSNTEDSEKPFNNGPKFTVFNKSIQF